MQRIQYIKNYNGKKEGMVEVVENNIAHGLVDSGVAIIFQKQEYQNSAFQKSPNDKMMKTTGKKKYRTKK